MLSPPRHRSTDRRRMTGGRARRACAPRAARLDADRRRGAGRARRVGDPRRARARRRVRVPGGRGSLLVERRSVRQWLLTPLFGLVGWLGGEVGPQAAGDTPTRTHTPRGGSSRSISVRSTDSIDRFDRPIRSTDLDSFDRPNPRRYGGSLVEFDDYDGDGRDKLEEDELGKPRGVTHLLEGVYIGENGRSQGEERRFIEASDRSTHPSRNVAATARRVMRDVTCVSRTQSRQPCFASPWW